MADFMGCLVTLDCGSVLGTYQGKVSAVCRDEQTLSIKEAFRNGVHCRVPEITLNASDIRDLQIIKSPIEGCGSTAKGHASQPASTNDKGATTGSKTYKPHCNGKIIIKHNGQKTTNGSNGHHKVTKSNARWTPPNRGSPSGYSCSPQFGQPLTAQKQGRLHGSADSLNDIVQITSDHGSHVPSGASRSIRVRANSYSECQNPRKASGRPAEVNSHRRRNQQDNCLTTSVQSVGDDFDFESNLALFDKQAVFEEIERDIDDGYLPQVTRHKQPAKYKCDENVLQSGPVVYRQIRVPGSTVEFVTDSGLIVPSVTSELRSKILASAALCGLSMVRQVEAVGRSTAEMALQLLGGNSRLNPQNAHQKPSVAILCGPHTEGAYGINCARHLSEHGVNVTLFIPKFVKMMEDLEAELKLYNLCSGVRISDAKDLPCKPMDMIISAVDSPDRPAILDIVWMGSVVQWASQRKAPVLVIDPPVEGGHIPAKWSVSVGLPLPLSTRCGKMYLVDLSIPRPVFKEHGIKYQSPFGHKFIGALHPKGE